MRFPLSKAVTEDSQKEWVAGIERGRSDTRAGLVTPHEDVMREIDAIIEAAQVGIIEAAQVGRWTKG